MFDIAVQKAYSECNVIIKLFLFWSAEQFYDHMMQDLVQNREI